MRSAERWQSASGGGGGGGGLTMDDLVAVQESQAPSDVACDLLALVPPGHPVLSLGCQCIAQIATL